MREDRPMRTATQVRPIAGHLFAVALLSLLRRGRLRSSLGLEHLAAATCSARVRVGRCFRPTCPVERKDHPCPLRPLGGVEIQARSLAGQGVATTRTRADGGYSFRLVPGSYVLVVKIAGIFPRCPHVPVSVRPRQVVVRARRQMRHRHPVTRQGAPFGPSGTCRPGCCSLKLESMTLSP